MNVRKIASFSQEDFEALKVAGTILGDLNRALNASDINELEETSFDIIRALAAVSADIMQNENLATLPVIE